MDDLILVSLSVLLAVTIYNRIKLRNLNLIKMQKNEDLKILQKKVQKINNEIYQKNDWYIYTGDYEGPYGPGILEREKELKTEIVKLKAIVAELCDYVYREK